MFRMKADRMKADSINPIKMTGFYRIILALTPVGLARGGLDPTYSPQGVPVGGLDPTYSPQGVPEASDS